jgi:hypothetical protein
LINKSDKFFDFFSISMLLTLHGEKKSYKNWKKNSLGPPVIVWILPWGPRDFLSIFVTVFLAYPV